MCFYVGLKLSHRISGFEVRIVIGLREVQADGVFCCKRMGHNGFHPRGAEKLLDVLLVHKRGMG
jgi:hypothetical protein